MDLYVEFSMYGDLISIPDEIFNDIGSHQNDFTKWIYDKTIDHKYWFIIKGEKKGVCYRADAFIEWLNMTILAKSDEKAVIIKEYINWEEHKLKYKDVPKIYF